MSIVCEPLEEFLGFAGFPVRIGPHMVQTVDESPGDALAAGFLCACQASQPAWTTATEKISSAKINAWRRPMARLFLRFLRLPG